MKFVEGLFWKTLALGAIIALIGYFTISKHFAGSILLGVLLVGMNIRAMSFGIRRMFGNAAEGRAGSPFWAALFGMKILVLFAAIFVCVVVLGANVIGFIIGYSVFLVAIVWQSIVYAANLPDDDETGDSAEGIENVE